MSLEKIALITAILGIACLIFLSENLEPKLRDISSITSKDIDNYVKVTGNITYAKQYSTSTLFKIQDNTGEMYGILYSKSNLTKGPATINGKVTEYRGILELEAEKIIG
jgi:RecJ-like exonuclease